MISSSDRAGLRVGIDLVPITEVFTPSERTACGKDSYRSARRLAERFAAKEAAIKVLQAEDGVGTPKSRSFHGPTDALTFHGAMGELARTAGLTNCSVSMTHSTRCAAAAVLVAASVGSVNA